MAQPIHYVHLIVATWFGVGRSPKAPGTVGSIAALPFAWGIVVVSDAAGLMIASAVLFVIGTWASTHYARSLGTGDPGEIVVDEVVGQWIAVIALPLNPFAYLLAFLAFRFFDILKPWPISLADQRLKGGFGIMADDVLAGLAALAVCWVLWPYIDPHAAFG